MCEGTIGADVHRGILLRHMLPSRRLSWKSVDISAQLGFLDTECMCLSGLPAVQSCLLLKTYGAS